jgi:DUF4097 and DUF4098 domain-containing protein YvlB
MKTLIKLTLALCFLGFNGLYSQEYTHDVKSAKKIEISQLTGHIKIIGQSGSSLVIKAEGLEEMPERAKGLKPLSGGGVDNTNVGLNITEAGGVIEITGTTKQSGETDYVFTVPNNIAVSVDYSSPFTSDDVEVENFGGEFEMKGMNDGVKLNGVTGPVFLDLINGDIEIVFTSVNQNSPMSIKSINGEVDVTIPAATKANFELSSLHGDIFTDLDIVLEKEKDKGDLSYFGGSSDVEGKLNGGGVKMNISSINGNIYLRKK